jgi:tetratricopeptide (TPR) repeat protein
VPPSRMIDEESLLRHVRDLLRHLDDSTKSMSNPILKRYLRGKSAILPERSAAPRSLIDAALVCLPDRLRSIVVRCDLAHEPHKTVAASLGLCRRYFYRQRRQALIKLGMLLERGTLQPQQYTIVEPLSTVRSHADALTRVGRFRQAISLLETTLSEVDSAELQHAIAYQLVDVCCEALDLDRARKYLAVLKGAASRVGNDPDADVSLLCSLEHDMARARIDWLAGAPVGLEQRLSRAVGGLRLLQRRFHGGRATEALCSGLTALSRLYSYNARYSEALATSTEALAALLKLQQPAPRLELQALTYCAHARMFAGRHPMSNAISEFSRAAAFAERHAFARDTVCLTSNLCALFAAKGEPSRGLRFGLAALDAAADLCSPNEMAAVCVELCAAYRALNETEKARELLNRFGWSFVGPYEPVRYVISADIFLKDGQFLRSLSEIQVVIDAVRVHGIRLLGSARLICAEALEGLGRKAAARTMVSQAVELLERSGNPVGFSRALRTSARLTGKLEHIRAAHDLDELLRR